MNNGCCLTLERKNRCNCFESIDYPVTCSPDNGTISQIWSTNTANPFGTFIITACTDLPLRGTIKIFVNDIDATGDPVATLRAGESFAYTASLLQSITVRCTASTRGTCTLTASLNVCFS